MDNERHALMPWQEKFMEYLDSIDLTPSGRTKREPVLIGIDPAHMSGTRIHQIIEDDFVLIDGYNKLMDTLITGEIGSIVGECHIYELEGMCLEPTFHDEPDPKQKRPVIRQGRKRGRNFGYDHKGRRR